ncbi:response regulator transcription factor [Paraburkholderia silviterrae]|uniref:response regulator transcription factor n=1 Tax=Paraburkholderia silviterrae TaxID=2528715 RepID=UPI003627F088
MVNPETPVVYVVDDDEPMRDGLDRLLRSVGLRTELFATPEAFLAAHRPDVPGCLVLDVRLRGTSGLALQQEIARLGVELPIIFMTGYGDIAMSVRAMKAGALDFLAKPFRDQDMLDAVANALARDRERRVRDAALCTLRDAYNSLTTREKEVLGLVLSGLMNKQIAAEIHLSEITVKIHRAQIMKKMGASTVADLVLKAASLGIRPTR